MPLASILLRNWPQFAKMLLLIVLVLIFSFGWVWFREIPNLQGDLIKERIDATRHPLQLAVSVVDLYRNRAATGELSIAEAQARALRALRDMRYGATQYFWVHDQSLTMRMHPFSPELEGTSLADYRDSRGSYIFRDMNRLLQDRQDAVIKYTWPRPGAEQPEQKMSNVRFYRPWGWVIGSGIYLDDVEADIGAIKQRVVTSFISAFLLATIFSLYVIYRINQPLRQTMAFARRVASGEPIASIKVQPETEGGKIITVIKGLLADLEAAYQRQRSIIETTGDGFFIVDAQGRFIELNDAFSRLVGYGEDELWQKRLPDLEEDSGEGEKDFAAIIARGSHCREVRYRRRDGTTVEVEVSATYAPELGGSLICFARDISERKRHEAERRQLEAQLIQSQKLEAIGKLAGGVAHEFNNILQVIAGYVMLLREERGAPTGLDYLDTIDTTVQRAARLTQGMLAYSRQQVFRLTVGDLNEAIRQVLPFLEPFLGEDIRLEVDASAEPITCLMDPFQIQQATINLVTNARDAIQRAGTIRIGTGRTDIDEQFVRSHGYGQPGSFAVLRVADNGTGMPANIRDKIFEPFYTTKEIGQGTGLGLSIVYGIVAQHNGFITCDSVPGEGTTFSIHLPLASDDTAPQLVTGTRSGQREEAVPAATILLAEDDEGVREVIRQLLEKDGHRVLCAGNGNEAVAIFTAFGPSIDLLLFDEVMPEKTGREALQEIRALNPTVPACLVSGYCRENREETQNPAGFTACIDKPVGHPALREAIVGLLRRPTATGGG